MVSVALNICAQCPLFVLALRVCVRARVVVCVCVCEREREREMHTVFFSTIMAITIIYYHGDLRLVSTTMQPI